MRKILALSIPMAVVACGGAAPRPLAGPAPVLGRAVIPSTWTLRSRPATAPHAMVVTAHPLATQAGVDILKQGGNAIDAAVAVAFALEVVLPDAGNIGGGGFIVYRSSAGDVTALDYREVAPAAATHDMFVDSARSRDIESDRSLLARFPASRAQFLVRDSAPPPGTMWRQPDLAKTLQLISDSGPDVFYRGQIADLIVAEMQRGGGLITKDDLRNYRAKWRTPIRLSYRGHTIYSMPPPSSGGVTMGEILNILEGYDTLPAFGTTAYVHLVTEAMRR